MESPEWKICPLNEHVKISRYGELKLMVRGYIGKEEINPKGYIFHTIGVNKRRVRLYLHDAVAAAFLSLKPSSDHVLYHKDGDKRNNVMTNLEWLTEEEYYNDFNESGYKFIPATDYEMNSAGEVRHLVTKVVLPKKVAYGFSKNGTKYTITVELWRRKLFNSDDNNEWRVYPLDNNYEVHPSGLIRVTKTKRIMKPLINNGYHQINAGSVRTSFHRMVAQTFLPPAENPLATTVNHINGDKSDNSVSNLEWATQSEQSTHAAKDVNRQKRKVIRQSADGSQFVYLGTKEAALAMNVAQKRMIHVIYKGLKIDGYTFTWSRPHYEVVEHIENEIWKQYVVDGVNTNYYVSNKGRVRTNGGLFRLNERFRYYQLTIIVKGRSFNKQVHIMVAEMFLNRPTIDSTTVDHVDKNTKNNSADNLEWVTRVEQNRRASAKPIAKYNVENELICEYSTAQIAAESENLSRYTLSKFAKSGLALNGHIYKQLPNSEYLRISQTK